MAGRQELHFKSVLFERDNLELELHDAMKQIDNLQAAIRGENDVSRPMNTQMDIRDNPYDELDVGEGPRADVSVDMGDFTQHAN